VSRRPLVTFRPLAVWPHPSTQAWERRGRSTFRAGWDDTVNLILDEIDRRDGSDVIIGAGLSPDDIRIDGLPRANARQPLHPGVEVSFNTRQGRLVFATDVCEYWQHNVRSIGLGLEALRAVDRYGITRKGEQYAGFAQLAAGESLNERGRRLVEAAGGIKAALIANHPDHGGDPADLAAVIAFRDGQP
jgi:hypothetical protein